jgi:hypothetical protein
MRAFQSRITNNFAYEVFQPEAQLDQPWNRPEYLDTRDFRNNGRPVDPRLIFALHLTFGSMNNQPQH